MYKVLEFLLKCLRICFLIYLSLYLASDIGNRFHDVQNAGNIVAVFWIFFVVVEFFQVWGISHTASLVAFGKVLLVVAVWVDELGSVTSKLIQVIGECLKNLGSG